jgi:hypothetical protein
MQEQPNYCPQCGNSLPEGSVTCVSCTTPVAGTTPAINTDAPAKKRLLLTPYQIFSLLPALIMLISAVVLVNSYTGWTYFIPGAAGVGWLRACFSVGLTCSIVTVLEIFRVLRGAGKKWNSIGLANTIAFGYFTLYTIIFLIVNKAKVFNQMGVHAQPNLVIVTMFLGLLGFFANVYRWRMPVSRD